MLSGTAVYADSEYITQSTAGFVRLSTTFTVPSDSSSDSVRLYFFLSKCNGTLYGDMAELEPGNTANRCNLVDNGDFHLGSITGFTGSGTTPEDALITVGTNSYRPVQNALLVTAASASVYATPSTSGTVVATVTKGTHLASMNLYLDSSSTQWYRVRTSGGVNGYIQITKATPYTSGGNGLEEAVVAVSGG